MPNNPFLANRLNSIFPTPGMMPPQGGISGSVPMMATDIGGEPVWPNQPPPDPMTPRLQDIGGEMIPPDMGGERPFDVNARMNELYTPSNVASDRFNELATGMPAYEKPGLGRTIAAALSAFGPGGHKTGQEVMNFNNDRNMTDWKNQIGPAQQAATLERQTNVNERTLAYQQVSQELRARADADKAANNEKSAAIRQQRADIYEFKAKNPNMKLIIPKGGNIQAFDPSTGHTIDLKIPTGTLSETDKINLNQENALDRQDNAAGNTRKTEGIKQAGREKLKGMPTPKREGSVTDKEESPAQTRTRYYNSAQTLTNTEPELAPFIRIEPGGRFTIEAPGGENFFGSQKGPTKEQYDKINKFIYGEDLKKTPSSADLVGGSNTNINPLVSAAAKSPTIPTSTSPVTPNSTPNSLPPMKLNAQGRVRIIGPDGKKVTVPKEQLEEAMKQGYKLQ